ncbi:hypothetical protein [Alienimonas californiensis]|uniref:YHS domain protein n=1 Tax=Alienimonas californiensis TaxID=2527989 RepID=A0A517P4E9_9PLAN|nr:hypothetical protein [Alienimonas californiensis]QDT14249.1 YHS domain protein [Alienimonas californiensis]
MPAVTAPARNSPARRPASAAAVRAETTGPRSAVRLLASGLLAGGLLASGPLPTASAQVPIPPPPAYEPPQLTPSLLDFLTGRPIANQMKLATTPELLKPEFVFAPPDSPKALAAKVKALELDVPNRIAAANYLGTLDCVQFPEAKQQLLQMALEDPFEEVRYAAVMNLQAMLARGLDNPDRAGGFRIDDAGACQCQSCKKATKEREAAVDKILKETKQFKHKAELAALKPETVPDVFCKTIPGLVHLPINKAKECCADLKAKLHHEPPPEAIRSDFCLGCCDEATLNGLAAIAHDQGETSPCAIEPSARVREAAAQAMLLCGCYKRPGFAYPCPEQPLPAPAPIPLGEGDPLPPGEGDGFGEGDGLDDGVLRLEIVPRADAPAAPEVDVEIDLNLELNDGPPAGDGSFELDELEIQILPETGAGGGELSPGRPDRGLRRALPLSRPSGPPTLPAPLPKLLDETASRRPLPEPSLRPHGAPPPAPVPLFPDAADPDAALTAPLFPQALVAQAPAPRVPVPDAVSPVVLLADASPAAVRDPAVRDRASLPAAFAPVAEPAFEPTFEPAFVSGAAPTLMWAIVDDREPAVSPAPAAAPAPVIALASAERPAAPAAAPLRGLRGMCVVELARQSLVPADPQFQAVHLGRTYHFRSAENREAFLADPEAFAPAFRGFDPVAYAERGEVVEGTVLRRFEGRFLLFERPEHWTRFCADPDRYRGD